MESLLINCVYPALLDREEQSLEENKRLIATALLVNKHFSDALSRIPAFHEARRFHTSQIARASIGLDRVQEFVRTRWAEDMLQAQLRTESGTHDLRLNWEDARDVGLWDDDDDSGVILGTLRSESLAMIAKGMTGPSAEQSRATLVLFNRHHSVDMSLAFGSSTYSRDVSIRKGRIVIRKSNWTIFGTAGEKEIKLSIRAHGDIVCIGMYTVVNQSDSDDDADDDADEQSDDDDYEELRTRAAELSIDPARYHLYEKIVLVAPWIKLGDFRQEL